MKALFVILASLGSLALSCVGQTEEAVAEAITNLTLPAKLDALKGDRAANQRLRKACYWLHVASDSEAMLEATIADTPRGRLAKDSLKRKRYAPYHYQRIA